MSLTEPSTKLVLYVLLVATILRTTATHTFVLADTDTERHSSFKPNFLQKFLKSTGISPIEAERVGFHSNEEEEADRQFEIENSRRNAKTQTEKTLPDGDGAERPLIQLPSPPNNDFGAGKRYKRQAPQHALFDLEHQFNLPAVPMPSAPTFPSTFQFAHHGDAAQSTLHFINAFASPSGGNNGAASSASNLACGGVYKARHGVIQTPNFPHKFQTPLECVWIIDASELPATGVAGDGLIAKPSIVVYLTQLYVLGGLKFTEYMYYSDDYKVPAHRVFTLTEDDVTQVAWVQFNSQYLEVRFAMASLDGTHLRALDRLLDVYGFNITYEVQDQVKPYQCNTLQCRFLGHCFAHADFGSYYCSCFSGFSGIDCGHGPLCEDPHTNACQNGGTCKHIGDAAITCHCPPGYKGTKCEIPEMSETTMGCTMNASLSDCGRECDFDGPTGATLPKHNRALARRGKTRYEVTIRLGANLTAFFRQTDLERHSSDHLPNLLERHLMRVLRNFNITKISDLELISNSTDRLDITFHFFGVKGDSNRIREAITRMVERGRIGNITLISNYHLFDENPPLILLDMRLNQRTAIREDSEFVISCTAQGSSRMQFQWYKDGALVNASKATREIWTTVLPPDTRDTFTAILGVTQADNMDEGIYTCKVIDWGVQHCRSLHVHIKSPPRLRVDPASVTLPRGDSLRVRCLSPGNDDMKRYAQLGYSWTRNGALFQSDPATVMWEDLYPDGSILKINNIQKSAEYACVVSNTVKPVSKSVYITVIDRSAVHVCRPETIYGVRWPTSAPGAAIISDCPHGFEGHSRRICEKRDIGNSSWLLPDFSLCIRDQLLQIHERFRALRSGYQQSNSSAILKDCLAYTLRRHKHFLPGEASFLIDMLHDMDSYLQLKGTRLEREMAAEIILHILDKVMLNTQSLNSQQQIKKLQLLTQSAALNRETIAASQLATSTSTAAAAAAAAAGAASSSSFAIGSPSTSLQTASSLSSASSLSGVAQADDAADNAADAAMTLYATATSNSGGKKQHTHIDSVARAGSVLMVDEDTLSLDRLNSLRIFMTSVKTLPFNLRIYGDDLFSDQLYMDIGLSTRLLQIMANATIFASVISYKNLKSFLPKTYYMRGSDPKETDYILASRIIQTWLFQSNRSNDNYREPLEFPFEIGHVEIIFQHETIPKENNWVAVCGHDYKASFESTWRSDLCITKNLMANITRCICPLSGTYVVMFTKRNRSVLITSTSHTPLFVVISCAGCFLQSCSAFAILLPIWCNRKCAITFLKMQFCVSTSSIMLIFLLGFLKLLPAYWQPVISSSMASLLLLGISTLIAIALVIHSELVPKNHLGGARIPRNHQAQREEDKRRGSTSGTLNATNVAKNRNRSSNIRISSSDVKQCLHSDRVAAIDMNFPSGIRSAIGISWLLPTLFGIASPLICTIIGKWPQNWWLEIMTTTTSVEDVHLEMGLSVPFASEVGADGAYRLPHPPPILNGDNFMESAAAVEVSSTTIAYLSNSSSSISNVSVAFSSSSWSYLPNMLSSAPTIDDNYNNDNDNTLHSEDGVPESPSLSFIIFVCIDILFVILFFALFSILIKKLLWLWRRNRTDQTAYLDRINVALRPRMGLLYRIGCLLVVKLTTDVLFIAYVNAAHDTLLCYPFGISCILLGFAVLFCFVIKAEYNPRELAAATAAVASCENADSAGRYMGKIQNLDDNYSTGSNINSPMSFYTNHEKERENESGAPPPPQQQMEMTSSVQLPLTILSSASHCQTVPPTVGGSVQSFLGGTVASSLERKAVPLHIACLQDIHPIKGLATSVASPATRCCSILGGVGSGGQTQTVATGIGYFDTYSVGGAHFTGSLSRRMQAQPQHELVGVETLDILQGVAPDSIIGIRSSNMLPLTQYHQHHQQHLPQQHQQCTENTIISIRAGGVGPMTTTAAPVIPELSSKHNGIAVGVPLIATTSVTTQTPKAQKRVTIMEPTTHTFDPLLPTMIAASGSAMCDAVAAASVTALPPIITITCSSTDDSTAGVATDTETSADVIVAAATTTTSRTSTPDDENSLNGMLDRITHDLDFLLNRTNEVPSSGGCGKDTAQLGPVAAAMTAVLASTEPNLTRHNVIEEPSCQELH